MKNYWLDQIQAKKWLAHLIRMVKAGLDIGAEEYVLGGANYTPEQLGDLLGEMAIEARFAGRYEQADILRGLSKMLKFW